MWALGGTVVWLHPRMSPTIISSRCFCLRLLPLLLPLMFLPLVLLLVRRRPSSFLLPILPPSMLNSSGSFLPSLFRCCYRNGTLSCLRVPPYHHRPVTSIERHLLCKPISLMAHSIHLTRQIRSSSACRTQRAGF